MFHRILLCALGALLFLAGPAFADGLVSNIQKNYETIKSIKAVFKQRLMHKESGSVEQRDGTLLFGKPLRVRWETAKPHPELLVITAREIWDFLPDEEVVYRYSPELVRDSRSLIQVVTGQARLDQDFKIKEEGVEKEPAPQLVEAVIWVDPEARLIRRAAIIDFYGNTNDVEFIELIPNAPLSGDAFAFTPPKGVEVEDRMESDVQERELFK